MGQAENNVTALGVNIVLSPSTEKRHVGIYMENLSIGSQDKARGFEDIKPRPKSILFKLVHSILNN